MPQDDYYKILGVSREASAEEIRKAYKKLSREYHPDINPAATEEFKKVQEAWDVLGNSEKRDQYDRYGAAFGQRGGPQGAYRPQYGSGPIDLGDLFGGAVDLGDLLGGFSPGGGYPGGGFGQQSTRRAPRKGQDARGNVDVPFLTAANGGQIEIVSPVPGQSGRLNVTIPAGIADGKVIRVAEQGHPSPAGGAPGDLLLTVRVLPHPYFRRDGQDLLIDVPITPSEAALGAKVEVPTLDEGKILLTVPPGSSSGRKFRLRGKGLLDPKTKRRGDQFVVLKIVVPTELNETTREAFERLAECSSHDPRIGLW